MFARRAVPPATSSEERSRWLTRVTAERVIEANRLIRAHSGVICIRTPWLDLASSRNIPTKTTFGGKPAIRFNATNQVSYDLITPVTLTGGNCTLALVTKQSASRVVALGGKAPNGSCFWGNASNTGSAYLYRNTADTGWFPTTLASVAGHKVFCAQIVGTTSVTYFDNSTTPVSVSAPLAGTFIFGKVGARDYGGINNSQPSDGYIAEIMVFTSIVPVSTCQTLVDALKTKYGV